MRVESLKVSGFRNIGDALIIPGSGANIICGDNAQGKTNLLEAIQLFSGARGFRMAKESDYISFDSKYALLSLFFFSQERSQTAEISLGEGKKQVLLNDIKVRRQSDLAGAFRTVMFFPDHLGLVKDGPDKRRKFLDISLCQAYPKYGKILEGYERILRQRGTVLKDAQTRPQVLDLLDAWDQSFIEYGAYLIWARMRYVARLAVFAGEIYDGICSGSESFNVLYKPGCSELPPDVDRSGILEILRESVRCSRSEDIRTGLSNAGPHRDDMEILIGGRSARSFGSQGQQRSCVLALKLAECRLLEESGGEPPVVLLDDVMSELDENRRNYLLNHLTGRQIFITCCDAQLFKTLETGKVFSVSNGTITELSPHNPHPNISKRMPFPLSLPRPG